MMHFLFSTQPAAPFSFIILSTSQFCSILLYLSPPSPPSPLCPPPPNLWLSNFPFISCLIFLSRCVCLLLACSCDVFRQKMKLVLPEGTVAGLKEANSSVGGCRPCEGSRVVAGEAGVCAGWNRKGKHDNLVWGEGFYHKSHSVHVWQLLTDGEVMSGGVDMSPKISNWLIFWGYDKSTDDQWDKR